jgi:formate-dependent nitrite reductase membrane component NrfD
MNETIIYNVFHENAYSYLIWLYFYVGGMGAGSFLVSALSIIYGKEKYERFTQVGAVSSLILIIMGGFLLLLDLGQPLRSFYLLTHFSVTSPISWGTIFIGGFSIISLIYNYYIFKVKNNEKAIICAKIGIYLSIALGSYASFLIALAKARPLWHSAVMPPLFLVSSCISGMAFILLIVNIFKTDSIEQGVMERMGKILAILILIDIFLLSDMYVLYIGFAEAHEMALLLLVGKYAFLFWGIELCLGSIFPVYLLLSRKFSKSRGAMILSSVCSLIGVLAMRYIIVIAGQHFPLS